MRSTILWLDRWLTGLAWNLASVLLAVISVLGLWQVLARFVFEEPTPWTEETMRRLLVWCVMLGTVVTFRRGALVSVDLMLRTSRGAWQHVVRSIVTIVSLLFLAVLLWFGIRLAWAVRFQTFASMELSMAWAYASVPVCAALGIVAVLGHHLDPIDEELENAQ
jgi:TRAP-type C4-dicarboxylate transport system permease small subunit